MSKQTFRLKVPADPVSEVVSHGNHDFTLKAGGTIETADPRVARWLEAEHGLELLADEPLPVSSAPVDPESTTPSAEAAATPPNQGGESVADAYPADFPGREKLIEANVAFDTVKSLGHEQLVAYQGIGPKTAAEILSYFADHQEDVNNG